MTTTYSQTLSCNSGSMTLSGCPSKKDCTQGIIGFAITSKEKPPTFFERFIGGRKPWPQDCIEEYNRQIKSVKQPNEGTS